MTAELDPVALLRGVGLRVTAPRIAVLAEVRRQPHADVDRIATGVRRRLGKVSTQTVYDVLRALTEAQLVRRIEPAGSPARFEVRVGDNHHHIVCRDCGAIRDVDCATGEAPCLHASSSEGFVVDEAEVTFWGICPECQTKADGMPDPGRQKDR
ncbi:MAG TPA: Fur family transcriptional regulator [Micromonospora sp.]|nr:Fur family transcriptional regulator [Micromonospora sp.]